MAKFFFLCTPEGLCFTYCTFSRHILKNFLAVKDMHVKFQTNWFENVDDRSDSKLISNSAHSGVMRIRPSPNDSLLHCYRWRVVDRFEVVKV